MGVLVATVMTTVLLSEAKPDAGLLKVGEFEYSDIQGGVAVANDKITIARGAHGIYRFANSVVGQAGQAWVATVTSAFRPLCAVLSFDSDAGVRPIFSIRYSQGEVTGTRYPPPNSAKSPVSVKDRVARDVIDQRVDWASVMARRLGPGDQFTFQVYDPAISTSTAVAKVEEGGRIRVPAGEYETYKISYRIEKTTGAELYVVFASKSIPRMLIREDFPDGVSSQLKRMP